MAEMLTVIGVLGVLAVLTIPIMKWTLPSKEEQMHNKMTFLVEQVSQFMVDNEAYYPVVDDPNKAGFLNTDEVSVDGVKYGGKNNPAADEIEANNLARKEKFCKLFAKQFSKASSGDVTCAENIEESDPTFKSPDGVDWWIPLTTFNETTNGQSKGYVKIKIDVNGVNQGSNCSEGTEGCKKPDRFYYLIKSNGAVTLADPQAIDDSTYQIIPTIITKDADGNIITTEVGGTVEIATISSDGSYGTFSNQEAKFKSLHANTDYILRAKPKSISFVSNWATKKTDNATEKTYGYKKVRITRHNTPVEVIFTKTGTYRIDLNIDAPDYITSANLSTYISSYKYKYNCKYVDKGANQGDYKRVSNFLDNYEYVGSYKGNYKYECSSSSNLTIGNNQLYASGLLPGEYQLVVSPATGYCLSPKTVDNIYTQNARLGRSDLSFTMKLRPCPSDEPTPETEPEPEPEVEQCRITINQDSIIYHDSGGQYISGVKLSREISDNCDSKYKEGTIKYTSWMTNGNVIDFNMLDSAKDATAPSGFFPGGTINRTVTAYFSTNPHLACIGYSTDTCIREDDELRLEVKGSLEYNNGYNPDDTQPEETEKKYCDIIIKYSYVNNNQWKLNRSISGSGCTSEYQYLPLQTFTSWFSVHTYYNLFNGSSNTEYINLTGAEAGMVLGTAESNKVISGNIQVSKPGVGAINCNGTKSCIGTYSCGSDNRCIRLRIEP